MSTNVPNFKQIGGGHRKNGQKFVDLLWNDPSIKRIAGCLLVMMLTFRYTTFSELFHGSARAIIRSLECGLVRAIARLKRDGLHVPCFAYFRIDFY